jgi:hypothetical protein
MCRIAWCPNHGILPRPIFEIGGSARIQITQSTTNCPQCGTRSEVIPGTYEAGLDRINFLLHSSASLQALGAIRKLAERAQPHGTRMFSRSFPIAVGSRRPMRIKALAAVTAGHSTTTSNASGLPLR